MTQFVTIPYSNYRQNSKHGWFIYIPVPTKKSFTPSFKVGGWGQRNRGERGHRDSCRKTEYTAIPYSNDSRYIKYGLLV